MATLPMSKKTSSTFSITDQQADNANPMRAGTVPTGKPYRGAHKKSKKIDVHTERTT